MKLSTLRWSEEAQSFELVSGIRVSDLRSGPVRIGITVGSWFNDLHVLSHQAWIPLAGNATARPVVEQDTGYIYEAELSEHRDPRGSTYALINEESAAKRRTLNRCTSMVKIMTLRTGVSGQSVNEGSCVVYSGTPRMLIRGVAHRDSPVCYGQEMLYILKEGDELLVTATGSSTKESGVVVAQRSIGLQLFGYSNYPKGI